MKTDYILYQHWDENIDCREMPLLEKNRIGYFMYKNILHMA